jgi:hypothetical protein
MKDVEYPCYIVKVPKASFDDFRLDDPIVTSIFKYAENVTLANSLQDSILDQLLKVKHLFGYVLK